MKKSSSIPSTPKKKTPRAAQKGIVPLDAPLLSDNPVDEPNSEPDQFAVTAREEEASSSGHRVEAIEPDDEDNAQKLVEEGLQGYMHGSLKKPRKAK